VLITPCRPFHIGSSRGCPLAGCVICASRRADEGHRRLDFASRLRIRAQPIGSLWEAALTLSLSSGVSPYDTLLVALAQSQDLPGFGPAGQAHLKVRLYVPARRAA